MEVNAMPDSNQLYAVIIGRNLMCQLQLKPDIVENMIEWHDITIQMVPHMYWSNSRIKKFSPQKVVKMNGDNED